MKARAIAHAKREPGPVSVEADALRMLDRFGSAAVFGQGPAPAKMLRRLHTWEAIVTCYRDYKEAPDGVQWATTYPRAWALIQDALKASSDEH